MKQGPGVIGASGLQVKPSATFTIDKAMKIRSFYSDASKGTGNLMKDISPNLNRQIASRLVRAANDDFEAMGQKVGGELGQSLQAANANYAGYSKSIDYVGNHVLSKMLGVPFEDAAFSGNMFYSTAGEKIAQRLIKMHPSEHRVLSETMKQHAPESVPVVRRFLLQNALDEGMKVPPSAGATPIPLSSNKFVNAIPDQKIMKNWFSNKENLDIRLTMDALIRWGDRSGANPSGTAAMNQFFQTVSALAHGGVRATITAAGPIMGLKRIASAMTTAEGREAIKTLTRTSGNTKALTAAANTLAVMWMNDYILYDSKNDQGIAQQSVQQPAQLPTLQ